MPANFRYFSGDRRLTNVYQDSKNRFVGIPEGMTRVWVKGEGWSPKPVVADRKIEYKSNPSRHDCDARCYNATGRIMKCECSCGGRHHGRGAFSCEAA